MDALDSFEGSFSKQLSQKALERRIPISGTFELLPYCNMHCKMCYIVHEKKDMSVIKGVGFWNEKIDEAIEQGMLYAVITGGEPFLYPGIRELLERINKKPIHLAINTNGTLLDRETVDWLSRTNPGRLNISLYGGCDETYARLCGNPKGFTQVTRAFALLNEYGIPFRVHTTVTPDNICDFDKIIDVCNQYHAPLQMVHYMFPPFRKEQGLITNEARFTPEEAAHVAFKIWKSKHKNDQERKIMLEANCACFKKPEYFSLYGESSIACRGGFASFWIDWRGRVSGCGIHAAESIDLTDIPFKTAWSIIVKETEKTKVSEKCQFCKYRCICPVCVAAAFCETGDIAGTPEYLCRFSEVYAKLLENELEKMREENV